MNCLIESLYNIPLEPIMVLTSPTKLETRLYHPSTRKKGWSKLEVLSEAAVTTSGFTSTPS